MAATPLHNNPRSFSEDYPPDLCPRVEEASLNAWPAMHNLLLEGWLIRMSQGFTRRANCVVPLYGDTSASAVDLLSKVRYCENLYAREQLHTLFRLTSTPMHADFDALLAERGYDRLDTTRVQVATLAASPMPPADNGFLLVPLDQWLAVYQQLAAMPATAGALHATLVRAIQPDCAYALIMRDGAPVACALGVFEHGLLGLFDVITAPAHRGAGHGRALLCELLRWGQMQGAEHAYLQVVATNTAALSLYRSLGFRNLYTYWYRQAP